MFRLGEVFRVCAVSGREGSSKVRIRVLLFDSVVSLKALPCVPVIVASFRAPEDCNSSGDRMSEGVGVPWEGEEGELAMLRMEDPLGLQKISAFAELIFQTLVRFDAASTDSSNAWALCGTVAVQKPCFSYC